jgi:DNA-binding NarL/FixJ family response regulator
MDVRMPLVDGVAATSGMRAVVPDTPVLALTIFDDDALAGIARVLDGYVDQLAEAPLSAQTRRTYASKVRQFGLGQRAAAVAQERARIAERGPATAQRV